MHLFIMKSYTKYTIKIKVKSKINKYKQKKTQNRDNTIKAQTQLVSLHYLTVHW